jgi:hypothetical protein
MTVLAEEGERVGKLDMLCKKEDGLGKYVMGDVGVLYVSIGLDLWWCV